MPNALSQKEKLLLQDQMGHEEICIKKYNSYSNEAQDPQLKQLFKTYAGQEQQHYDTLNQILSGQTPNMSAGQAGQAGNMASQVGNQSQASMPGTMNSQSDADLCTDMLMTEKYVSSAYNTAIFEFADANTRQALNHIQKEEQQHGEGIFNFMQSKGMYNVQG